MKRALSFSTFCLGFSATITQILLLREFLNVFSGNELVLGVILAFWLLLTGLGSYLGCAGGAFRKSASRLIAAQLLLAVLPLATVIAIRFLKAFWVPGESPGIQSIVISSLFVLLPYCLSSGFILTILAQSAADTDSAQPVSRVYITDTIGGILGGLLFSLVFVHTLSTISMTSLLVVLNCSAASLLGVQFLVSGMLKRLIIAFATILSTSCLALSGQLDSVTLKRLLPGQFIIEARTTPYGQLIVTGSGKEKTVFQNSVSIGSTGNIIAAEETAHFGLAQHTAPRDILLLSGGLNGAIAETLKYPVRQVDYVELDPAVIALVAKLQRITDQRVRTVAMDARKFIRSIRARYDVILSSLPDPASAQLNRFYTTEFFRDVRQALRPGGVFALAVGTAANYVSPEQRILLSSVRKSLGTAFEHILILPGERYFLIASDRSLNADIGALLSTHGVTTLYVQPDYLRGLLTSDRLQAADKASSAPASINRDFSPVCYHAYLRFWLREFGGNSLFLWLSLGLPIVGLLLIIAASPDRTISTALAASGFVSIGLEVVLLLAFQVVYGYVYEQLGVIISAFLFGAALGAFWAKQTKRPAASLLFLLDIGLACACLILPRFFSFISLEDSHHLHPRFLPLAFPLLNGIIGFLTGAQFPPAEKLLFLLRKSTALNSAASLFSADLLGAALGALLVGVFLVPLLGLPLTCLVMGGLKAITSVLLVPKLGLGRFNIRCSEKTEVRRRLL